MKKIFVVIILLIVSGCNDKKIECINGDCSNGLGILELKSEESKVE